MRQVVLTVRQFFSASPPPPMSQNLFPKHRFDLTSLPTVPTMLKNVIINTFSYIIQVERFRLLVDEIFYLFLLICILDQYLVDVRVIRGGSGTIRRRRSFSSRLEVVLGRCYIRLNALNYVKATF